MLLSDFYDIRDLQNLVEWITDPLDGRAAYVVAALLGCLGILAFVGTTSIINIWIERRVIARMQARLGPNRVGPFGLLQPLADAIKLIQKEVMVPRSGDRIIFLLAPALVFIPPMFTFGVIPWGENMTYVNVNVGVLFLIAFTSVTTVLIFMAAWASNNKYALFGAMRVIAMLVSYEVPLVLAAIGPVIFAGSMSLQDIVLFQQENYVFLILLQPLAFVILFLAATAEINRSPFDLAEAESEIVAGYLTEFSGMKWGLFYAVELVNALTASAVVATLFLGGWWLYGAEEWIPGWMIMIGKIYLFYFVFMWFRGTLPRLRMDQLMAFAWKYLLPLALLNIAIAGLQVTLWLRYDWPAEIVLPIFAAINIGLIGLIALSYGRLLGRSMAEAPRRARMGTELGQIYRAPV
ncbi:MAG: NADH-quinone oxidoreductase subunit NuoH [Dehalococcoidia bacterium]|nr:NADH-quinone oxidoreductase subunit NuoH [Dehalococcoidia bacterium]